VAKKLLRRAVVKSAAANLSVGAGAGCGKTTTIVWGCSGTPEGVTLSDEQQPIIDHLNSEPTKSMRFTAFSKAIQTELEARLPSHVECCTNHSLGLRTLKSGISGYAKVNANKTYGLYIDSYGDPKTAKNKKEAYQLLNETKDIVSIAKSTLACDLEASQEAQTWIGTPEQLTQVCNFYSVDHCPGSINRALEVLKLSFEQLTSDDKAKQVDFDDMVAGPAVLGIEPERVAHGIVDECQDMNAAQLWLASHSCDRLSTIGDVNQSIFGFAGADPSAIPRLEEVMSSSPRSILRLPLMETRRCAKSIVEVCQGFVPEFKAHSSNPVGSVERITDDKTIPIITAAFQSKTDLMVLCRTNAPLTKLAMQLLKLKLPVYIKGKKIAQGLMTLIRKLCNPSDSVAHLLAELEAYKAKEAERLMQSTSPDREQKLVDLYDRCEIITIFCEDCWSVQNVLDSFDTVFSDENKKNAIPLSSVHRSKGLEADTIIIIKPELLPHPKIASKSEFNRIQEKNLGYVGCSRAKNRLIFAESNDLKELDENAF
jgi:DNA helicase-2/ATP-dependent DNA helicase PcrA